MFINVSSTFQPQFNGLAFLTYPGDGQTNKEKNRGENIINLLGPVVQKAINLSKISGNLGDKITKM